MLAHERKGSSQAELHETKGDKSESIVQKKITCSHQGQRPHVAGKHGNHRSPEGRLELRRDTVPTGKGRKRHTTLHTGRLKTACPEVCGEQSNAAVSGDDRSTDRDQRGGQHGRPRGSKAGQREEQHEAGLCWATHTHSACTENRDRQVGASHELD